jgi:hypothetical protein
MFLITRIFKGTYNPFLFTVEYLIYCLIFDSEIKEQITLSCIVLFICYIKRRNVSEMYHRVSKRCKITNNAFENTFTPNWINSFLIKRYGEPTKYLMLLGYGGKPRLSSSVTRIRGTPKLSYVVRIRGKTEIIFFRY